MRVLLPNEPNPHQVITERLLTERHLIPALQQIEHCFLEVRRQLDVELAALRPMKLGKPYPLGQCLEIALAFETRIQEIDVSQLSEPSAEGYRVFKAFLKAGGSFRQVWGDLRGQYFQNAFQLGSLYVDVSNDTVVPTKPKVEVLPFEAANFKAVRSYEQFASIAQSYWEVDIYPNHLLPDIAPHCPVLVVYKSGKVMVCDASHYMLQMTRTGSFKPSEDFLNAPPMPQAVFASLRDVLIGKKYKVPADPESGRKLALANCRIYREKRWHRSVKKLDEITHVVNQLNHRHLAQFKLPSVPKDTNMTTITIDNKSYDLDQLSKEAKAQLSSLQFVDAELARLQAQTATLQTARMAYARALQAALPVIGGSDTLKLS